ncbi:nucleotide-binding protein [Pararhizobium sp. BT-229]|uniref:nucleotide-binding protein n=1 Tax=Pararhizobium sp. BT-229 TaxID=2986923 RepID=UPI0021F6B362|nr:nucleotide-binding protein [Pararhizobium sp. BT-229]MCV9965693.1 nucleotide-binding protein [Pararhizobium sp. BT-229]
MKPRLFIGSSTENLEIAYALQESLEHDAEPTVWSQGVFDASKYTMEALNDLLDETDFAVFVFAPDDVTNIRKAEKQTVRDNVIFELGLFIGRIGRERCFIVIPRGVDDFHLPSDLLGLTPATYDPERQDANVVAALGPAVNRIRKAMARAGSKPLENKNIDEEELVSSHLISDQNDCISLIESWMGRRSTSSNMAAIKFRDVDMELGLATGSAEKYIEIAARRWEYKVSRRGEQTIIFRD